MTPDPPSPVERPTPAPLALGAVASARPWRGALQRHCRDHVVDTVVRIVRDARDALEEPVEVLVLDDDTSYLSAPFVARLRERGVVTVGLYDPTEADGHGYRHLVSIGVDLALPASLPPDELLDALGELRSATHTGSAGASPVARAQPEPARRGGPVIAVGGPAGAGGTEIAIALAHQWSRWAETVLVDLDESHASIGRRLGLAVHPHVVTAVEAVRREQLDVTGQPVRSLADCLARPAVGVSLPFDVVVGVASPADWPLLRADDIELLVLELASQWSAVIVRVGPVLEDLSRFVDRYGTSRRALGLSHRAVGVCEATPMGVLRFLDWLADGVDVLAPGGLDVVLNRVIRSPEVRVELAEQLRRIGGDRIRSVTSVPYDRRVGRAAWDAGLAGRGPFRRAVAELADCLVERAP
jgi:hypothetical protein